MPPHLSRQVVHRLYTDGAARGNPGPAGIGVLLETSDGELVEEFGRGIGWATNNVAEYQGLIEGLRLALCKYVDGLHVYMDSLLVVRQVQGKFKVKHPGLKPLHATALGLAGEFKRIRFEAVPRERNVRADRLCNLGIDMWLAEHPDFEPPAAAQAKLL